MEATWAKSVFWMYTVLATRGKAARKKLMDMLRRKLIETRVAFWPLHKQPFAPKAYRDSVDFRIANRIGNLGLSLPSGNGITEAQVRRVGLALRSGG